MNDIKLFVCCHKEVSVPDHPLLVPLQVGTVLADKEFPGFLHDHTGDNISEKNRSYCELTAQYWAWKNVDAEYYGFFHYRRYLYPDINAKLPYRIERQPTTDLLNKLGYNEFASMIHEYDLIVPKPENMYVSVRDHYANAPDHHKKDLDLIESIVREKTPDYLEVMDEYLSGNLHYFGNIFIMRRDIFKEYCEWLFPILSEFDWKGDVHGYGQKEIRVDGYLAERLLGIYYTQHRGEYKTTELPKVLFCENPADYWKNRVLNAFLPPGSKRRSTVKKIRYG